jgi:hypothetical protein
MLIMRALPKRLIDWLIARQLGLLPPKLTPKGEPQLNEWSLTGKWTIGQERAQLDEKDGSIIYRFHARDLHLVLGPSARQAIFASASPSTASRPAMRMAWI